MKREEKNLLSRQKILESALVEFSRQGYAASSVNTICGAGNISKGNLYHYFKDKDELYLLCVKTCFDELTAYLRENVLEASALDLDQYFAARQRFFRDFPMYQRLFCDAVVTPPLHLEPAVREIRSAFDHLSLQVLTLLLKQVPLRQDVTLQEVLEVFQQYQDFINARYQTAGTVETQERETRCSRALSILLYGVAARKEDAE